jgi:hypothetical protein
MFIPAATELIDNLKINKKEYKNKNKNKNKNQETM